MLKTDRILQPLLRKGGLSDKGYTTRDPSDAQIPLITRHESKNGLEIDPPLPLDAMEQAYREAVQGVSIRWTPNDARITSL